MAAIRKTDGSKFGRIVVKNSATGFAVYYPRVGVARRISTAAQVRDLAQQGLISPENALEVLPLLPDDPRLLEEHDGDD